MPTKSLGTIELLDSGGRLHFACQLQQATLPLFICNIRPPGTASMWRLRDGSTLTTEDGFTFRDLEGRMYELIR